MSSWIHEWMTGWGDQSVETPDAEGQVAMASLRDATADGGHTTAVATADTNGRTAVATHRRLEVSR